jgi:signal transduction histidine kinase/CheY-like chemotaxis protein
MLQTKSKKRKLILLLCTGFYIAGLVAFFYFHRSYQEKVILQLTDERLKSAALSIAHILPADFQDRAEDKSSVSYKEEIKWRRILASHSAQLGISELYTVIEKDDRFYFSASTVSEKEASQSKRWYFMAYDTIPVRFKIAYYNSKEPVFATFSDQWGQFRSCAIPMISPGGRKYLACADSHKEELETRIAQAHNSSFYISLFFSLLGMPVFLMGYYYLIKLDRLNEELVDHRDQLEILAAKRTLELERARDELIHNREQLLLALQTGKISVFKWNLRAEVIEFTQTMLQNLEKFRNTRFSTRFFRRSIHPEDRDMVMRKLAKYISGLTDQFNVDFRIKIEGDNWRWFHIIGKIIERSATGIGQFMVGIVEDITELRNRETSMQQSQKLEAVGQLAGGIAHDFNNMLQAIMGYAEMVQLSLPEDDENYTCIEMLIEAAGKSQTLVRQLLTFSRMSQEVKETLDVNRALEDYSQLVKRLLGPQIELVTELAENVPYVRADSGQFEQVIINLCVNARDAMGGKGKITIKTEEARLSESFCFENPWARSGHYVKISVIDNGPGIAAEDIKKIFEPFYTTKEVGKGTGLGLAIVYGVVQKHDGLLHLESKPGNGASFQIYLPASDIMSELKARTSVEVDSTLEGSETILLAEDSELVRNFAGRMLRKAGYNVIFAIDGQQAVEKFMENKDKIDILVFDIIMPKMTGKAAYEVIKNENDEVPVVFCSGYHEEILDTSFYSDFNGCFIPKPYKTVDLLRSIRRLLDEQKLRGKNA